MRQSVPTQRLRVRCLAKRQCTGTCCWGTIPARPCALAASSCNRVRSSRSSSFLHGCSLAGLRIFIVMWQRQVPPEMSMCIRAHIGGTCTGSDQIPCAPRHQPRATLSLASCPKTCLARRPSSPWRSTSRTSTFYAVYSCPLPLTFSP